MPEFSGGKTHRFAPLQSRGWRLLGGGVGLVLVAVLDYVVGPEFILAILYLVPILFVAWFVGQKPGLLVAFLSWAVALHNAGVFTPQFEREPLTVTLTAVTTLTFFWLTAWLAAELHDKQLRLQRLVDVDGVTGAATSHLFYARAQHELQRLERYGRPLTFAYLDLDNFKQVNDTLGHASGDVVLKEVVDALKDNTRVLDCVARLGGDEFALLLPETSPAAARTLMTKLHATLTERMRMHGWPVTFSIGVLTCTTGISVDVAMKATDRLMYRVKHAGKDAVAYDVK